MALINCPECNKEISDQSDKCIHCGFPLLKQQLVKCRWCATLNKESWYSEYSSCPECGFSETKYKTNKYLIENNIPIVNPNTPKCPHCKSTNISKIGTGERVGSIAMWGIFSNKINKSFKCKSCGYTW